MSYLIKRNWIEIQVDNHSSQTPEGSGRCLHQRYLNNLLILSRSPLARNIGHMKVPQVNTEIYPNLFTNSIPVSIIPKLKE